MFKFKDSVQITVSSGAGGEGCVSFLREKFNAKGGPDGGDGGRGGNVVFKVKENLRTLSFYKNGHNISAKSGKSGMGETRTGAAGEDLILFVPPNTSIYSSDSDEFLFELISKEDECIVLKGGRGGLGNVNFKNSVRRAPKFAQPGEKGEVLNLRLELSLIADIGLVGLPNVGKSSLITRITNSRSKVADYPFTTKIPHLGVLRYSYYDLIIADVPGIIEGASHGAGLGYEFLKHIGKTKVLAFIVDISENNFLETYDIVLNELNSYNKEFLLKKRIIIANKLDLDGARKNFEELKEKLKDEHVIGISIYGNEGIDALIKEFFILSETV